MCKANCNAAHSAGNVTMTIERYNELLAATSRAESRVTMYQTANAANSRRLATLRCAVTTIADLCPTADDNRGYIGDRLRAVLTANNS